MYKPYTNDRFERLSKHIDTMAKDILEAKKHVYSPDDDRLEDFHFVAQALGIRPAQVAAVYLLKHAQSISVRVRNRDYQWYDNGGREGLMSRAADIINLTKLLMACVDEEMENSKQQPADVYIDGMTGREQEPPTLKVTA